MVAMLGRTAGLDRDKAFYPTVLIVVASYYVLFAVMGGTAKTMIIETVGTLLFLMIAVLGFKFNLWLVAAALAGHGVFDLVHSAVISNASVPVWWPSFCAAFDVTAGIAFGLMLWRQGRRRSVGLPDEKDAKS